MKKDEIYELDDVYFICSLEPLDTNIYDIRWYHNVSTYLNQLLLSIHMYESIHSFHITYLNYNEVRYLKKRHHLLKCFIANRWISCETVGIFKSRFFFTMCGYFMSLNVNNTIKQKGTQRIRTRLKIVVKITPEINNQLNFFENFHWSSKPNLWFTIFLKMCSITRNHQLIQ